MSSKISISLPFHPYNYESKGHIVEKEDKTGKKRRYLCGVSSGIKIDGHGERMTKNAIESVMRQANEGEILLYTDIHGIKQSQDIGRLVKAEVLANGDWYTEYRLYDEHDDIGQIKLETIETLWRQLNGLSPYEKPIQMGFSIEGTIPEGGLIDFKKDEYGMVRNRVIDDIVLDGVVLVPRPAYQTGIANAIYKALNEVPPWQESSLKKGLQDTLKTIIQEDRLSDAYYKSRWELLDALDKQVKSIMEKPDDGKRKARLDILFKEFSEMMIELVIQSEQLFQDSNAEEDDNAYVTKQQPTTLEVCKGLNNELEKLTKVIKSKR